MNGEEAKKKIEELDLQYQILDSIYNPKMPEGTVLEQLVEPTGLSNVHVKSGRIIGLRLTKRTQMVEMPSLVHKQLQFAESILEQRGLRFSIQYRATSEANGSVLDQLFRGRRIKEGDRIPIGAVVNIVYSSSVHDGKENHVKDVFKNSIISALMLMSRKVSEMPTNSVF